MKRRTKQQWLDLIARQQQSGLTARQFCHKENIVETYFSTRKCQLLKKHTNSPQAFTKVNIKPALKHKESMAYIYKNSTLKFEKLPDPKWLSKLLSSLS